LAHYAEGHPVLLEGMRQMPTLQLYHTATVRIAYSNERFLAIRTIGARHNRTLPHAIWQLKFLLLGINYFIKWVETEPLATITEKNV